MPLRRLLRNDLPGPPALTPTDATPGGGAPAAGVIPLRTLGTTAVVAIAAASTAYLLHLLVAVFTSRHLFGDAAWFLLKMLSEDRIARWNAGLSDLYVGRFGAFALQEYPTLLFSRLGVTHLPTLSTIYGLTLFAFKPLSLLLVYRFSPDRRAVVFPLLTLFAGSMNAECYIVSETHLFVALFWVALVILASGEALSGGALAALAAASLPLLLCYETMALYGLILMAVCIYRLRRSTSRAESIACRVLLGWYLLGVVLATLSIVNPRDAANRTGFLQGTLNVLRGNHLGARVSCVVLALVLVILLLPIRRRAALRLVVLVSAALSALIVLQILVRPGETNLDYQVMARGFNAAVPLAVVPLYLLWRFGRLGIDRGQFRALFLVTACLGIAQSSWNVLVSSQWSEMLASTRAELRERSGIIPFETSVTFRQTLAGRPIRDLHGDWPVLPLSIVLADGGAVGSLIDPGEGFFRPFHPDRPSELPALRRFGVRYDRYLAAVSATHRYRLGEPIVFAASGNAAFWKTGSWSYPEAWGTWSDGTEFGLVLDVAEPVESDVILTATVGAFVNAKQPELDAEVQVNGQPAAVWRFVFDSTRPPYEARSLTIPKALFDSARPLRITFRLSKATSPADLGQGGDPRKIGLGFVRAQLDHLAD